MRFGIGTKFPEPLVLPAAPAIIRTRGSGLIQGHAAPSGLIKAGFRTRALISTSAGGGFSDSDWPGSSNRPAFNSGTNVLTWVGPSGGGANNGSPVQQTLTLTNSSGITTTGANQTISGKNVSGIITVNHSGCTIQQCRIADPGSQGFGAILINATVTGLLVEDCLIDGSMSSLCGLGSSSTVGLSATTQSNVRRTFITGFENHISLEGPVGWSNINITDNYFAKCGNSGNALFDGDMIECYHCDTVLVQHNMFDGTGSQTTSNAFNSMFNISNLDVVTNITLNDNMFANGNGVLGDGMVIDTDTHFGASAFSWVCTNNGFFNIGSNTYCQNFHNSVAAPNPSPNSGNYDAASQTATSGTLINSGSGQV